MEDSWYLGKSVVERLLTCGTGTRPTTWLVEHLTFVRNAKNPSVEGT